MRDYILLILLFILALSCTKKSTDQVVVKNSKGPEVFVYSNNNDFNNSSNSIIFNKALDEVQNRHFKKAKKLFLKVYKNEPDNLIILNSLGNTEKELNNFEKASQYYKKAIMIDSSYAHTYINFATACNRNYKHSTAIQILTKGIQIETDNHTTAAMYYAIAVSYYRIKNYESAISFNKKAINLTPEHDFKKDMLRLNNLLLKK